MSQDEGGVIDLGRRQNTENTVGDSVTIQCSQPESGGSVQLTQDQLYHLKRKAFLFAGDLTLCEILYLTELGVIFPFIISIIDFSYQAMSIGNLLCVKKIVRRTVWLERMKVNLVIFDVRFIFCLINETDTIDFSIYA